MIPVEQRVGATRIHRLPGPPDLLVRGVLLLDLDPDANSAHRYSFSRTKGQQPHHTGDQPSPEPRPSPPTATHFVGTRPVGDRRGGYLLCRACSLLPAP